MSGKRQPMGGQGSPPPRVYHLMVTALPGPGAPCALAHDMGELADCMLVRVRVCARTRGTGQDGMAAVRGGIGPGVAGVLRRAGGGDTAWYYSCTACYPRTKK
eukprot:7389607-Prymnesium_polylepis.1